MEITSRPAALSLFASASTSIAWKGSTALRPETGMAMLSVPCSGRQIAARRTNARLPWGSQGSRLQPDAAIPKA
jgi:hypothetical protein